MMTLTVQVNGAAFQKRSQSPNNDLQSASLIRYPPAPHMPHIYPIMTFFVSLFAL